MDGNGRWARSRGLPRSEGHKAGSEAARGIVTACRELGIPHLTLYTFSKENWSRPKDEIRVLFDLLVRFLRRELDTLLEQDIRLLVLGEPQEIPMPARQVLQRTVERTAHCGSMTVNLALNYSGRDEILRACRSLLERGLDPEALDHEAFAANLYTEGQPDPDLIIRTSGEQRLSNYLLYQSAYSELHFTDVLWPDFDKQQLLLALEDFAGRQRRFGRTGEQAAGGEA
jgi:undecaprenyl diphosphate synthase